MSNSSAWTIGSNNVTGGNLTQSNSSNQVTGNHIEKGFPLAQPHAAKIGLAPTTPMMTTKKIVRRRRVLIE